MGDPVVYGPGYSTYARSLRLALEEKGVAYKLEEVDIFSGANQEAEHVARCPFAKVPAFEHEGFSIYETDPTMRYIDEAFEGPSLQPDSARDRARMGQVLGIVDSYAYAPMIGQIFIQRAVTPMLGGEADEAAIEAALPQARTAVEALESLLGDSAYFAGDQVSLADLHVLPVIDYFSQTPEGQAAMAGAPNLSRWLETMQSRPSVAKTKPQLG